MFKPNSESSRINIGYVPLLDCAPLIVAQQAGFFQQLDLNINLVRESNWASIRDKLSYGLLDAAHMPAPMVLASHIIPGKNTKNKAFKTAVALGYNGNAISFSKRLLNRLSAESEQLEDILSRLKAELATASEPVQVGTVHTFSMHSNLLRLLFQKAGINDDAYQLVVIPPMRMVSAMKDGIVDIVCVGEPWNTAAQLANVGQIVCYGSELWAHAPEKVLGINPVFAEQYPSEHQAIVQAIIQASQWLEQPDHMAQAALWLAQENYLNCSSDLLIQAMINQWHLPSRPRKRRKIFYSENANAPWPQHAQWIAQTLSEIHSVQAKQDVLLEDIYDWKTYAGALQQLDIEACDPAAFPGDVPESP